MDNVPFNTESEKMDLIDEPTKKRISEHLKNEKDIITDDDIKNVKTNIGNDKLEEQSPDDKEKSDQSINNRSEIIEKIISIT